MKLFTVEFTWEIGHDKIQDSMADRILAETAEEAIQLAIGYLVEMVDEFEYLIAYDRKRIDLIPYPDRHDYPQKYHSFVATEAV